MKKLLPAFLFLLFLHLPGRAQVSGLSNPLKDSVGLYVEQGKYAKALSFAAEWKQRVEEEKGLSSVEYGAVLNLMGDVNRKSGLYAMAGELLEKSMQVFNLDSANRKVKRIKCFESKGDLEKDLGKYEVAKTLYQKALSLVDSSIKEEFTLLGHLYSDLGMLYLDMGKSDESGFYQRKSLGVFLSQSGENDPNVATCYSNLGILSAYLADFKKAEVYQNKAFAIRKRILKPNHPDLAFSHISFGILFSNLGDHDKARPHFFKALEIQKKAFGNAHPLVAETYNSLGLVHSYLGEFKLSEQYYLKALNLRKGILPENHPDLALNYNNLGTLYIDKGLYRKGGPYLMKALEIRKKCFGENHPEVAESLGNLGIYYSELGDYEKAERCYSQELEILKVNFGEIHTSIASSLNAFGAFNMDVGNYEKAIFYFRNELEVLKKIYPKENGAIADAMANMGNAYSELGNLQQAEFYTKKSLAINRKTLGSKHPSTATDYFNLSQLYFSSGRYFKASKLNRLALNLRRKHFKELHPDVAKCYSNEADLHEIRGEYPKAIACHKKAISIMLEIFGEEHPDVQLKKKDLAGFYWARKDVSKASLWFEKLMNGILGQIERYFPALSESEKAKYVSKVSEGLMGCYSFCVEQGKSNPRLLTQLFDSRLITKGILLNASLKLKHSLRMSTDSMVQKKFQKWEELQDQISKNYSKKDEEPFAPGGLIMKSEKLEKELIQQTGSDILTFKTQRKKWQDVQNNLKPGEAAIEMVRVRKYGISKIVTDTSDPKKPTYKIKGLTDTAFYAALIVKTTSKYPEMVLLKNGNALEEKWIQVYKNSIRQRVADQTSYNQFWKKIDAKLGPAVKRVYFSPDGVYNSINLNTLQNPKTGNYLLDEKDIRLVTNTKDIVTASVSKPNPAFACLVGFPDYNTDKDKRALVFQQERNHPEAWYNLNLTRSDAFGELPATKTEVENISGLMQSNGWQVESLLGENALEESIKAVQKPRVLHIATHGFFQPDTTKGSNPLIHSGLLLTGANKTLAGEKDDKVDDGILTAYEAMNLNLDNTDLVVLSACETGLGEIKNGEGVYGLQRAFKVAGAKSIIMSLWKVSDEATQELMVGFYKHWLNSPQTPEGGLNASIRKISGNSTPNSPPPQGGLGGAGTKRQAFLKAQKELKAKYPEPYYWGAFVMVGE